MEAKQSLTFRLESYLVQLSDINRRWAEWLAGSEIAAVDRDHRRLEALQPQAEELFQELNEVIVNRQQLLDDARKSGLPHGDLTSLAMCLPAWEKTNLRSNLQLARQQLANLRRLHVASWVLLSQVFNFYQDSLQLLMEGNRPHVYSSNRQVDSGGGRLLDQSL